MTLKLGRWPFQPLDSLSFSYYHKLLREQLLTRYSSSNANSNAWGLDFIEKASNLSDVDFIHYLFLSSVGRKANDEELITLTEVITNRNYLNNRPNQARIIFDYVSRLPETYFNNRIN